MKLETTFSITQTELEEATGGIALEELIESIDETLLFLLFNAHKLNMETIKGRTWSLYMIKHLLVKVKESAKE